VNSPIATVEMMKKVFERQRRPYGLPLPVIDGIVDENGVDGKGGYSRPPISTLCSLYTVSI